jgi:hypothetical protein
LIRFLAKLSPTGKVRLALGVVGALLLAYLVLAGKPWSVPRPWENLKPAQFATVFLWFAAAINLVLAAFLAATAPWWTAPLRGEQAESENPNSEIGDRDSEIEHQTSNIKHLKWFWPLVIAAMALTAIIGWPRLGQSLWHDEAYPVKRAIVGNYRIQDDGSLKLKTVSWNDTFFYYKKPNHMLHSVLCRITNDTWRLFARPKGLQFHEVALRIPTYLAGIASVACLALFVRKLGYPSAAVIAAFFLALHPWQIRYATEGRAYAFVFVLLPLLFYFFLKALEAGRWRWWAAFAATEVLLLHAYLTCIHVLVIFNLCAPLVIWFRYGKTSQALTLVVRWFVANIFAAMAFFLLMLPIVPQLIAYLDETHGLGDVDYRWTQSFLSHLLAGISWNNSLKFESPYLELYPWAVMHPGMFVLICLLGIGFLALGIRRLVAAGPARGLLVLPLLLPAIGCFIQMRVTSGHMYVWYIIFVLPGVVALVAVGLDEIIAGARSWRGKIFGAAFVALLLSSYAAWTAPQRHRLMSGSMQPNRESVLLTRPTLDPMDPRQKDIITATFFGDPYPYDPNMVMFSGMTEFRKLLERADAENKPLFINLGYLVTVEGEHPNKYDFLKNSGLFEDLGILRGFETLQSRHVFKYKPGSAAGFDFASVPKDPGSPGHEEKD